MKKFLIKKYVDKLTTYDIEKFARNNNINLNNSQIDFFYNLIKENWENIIINDDSILYKIKNNFNDEEYKKIEKLYYEYKQKYQNYLI